MLADVPGVVSRLPSGDDARLLREGAARLAELLGDPVEDRMLHWDLHYANVLASYRDGNEHPWLAIDPKPLAGDPGFDLLPALWNRWEDVIASGDPTAHVLRRFDLMCELLGLDRARSAGWTIARVLQNALWDLGKFEEPHIDKSHLLIMAALLEHRR